MKRENGTEKKENIGGPAGSNDRPKGPDKLSEAPTPKEGSVRKVAGKTGKGERMQERTEKPDV